MMDQTPDKFTRPPKCEYAACYERATDERDGWDFCASHANEHDLIMAGADLPDLPRHLLPFDHGTEGGYKRHLRLGVPMCSECGSYHLRNQASRRKSRARVAA